MPKMPKTWGKPRKYTIEPGTGKRFTSGIVKKLHDFLLTYCGERKVEDYTVKDMLTDIRHYCDAKGFDFYELLDSSYNHYLAERRSKGVK